jgi:hypothetical protein
MSSGSWYTLCSLNLPQGLCYNPSKDLVIPSLKPPDHYKHSPLMGALPQKRDVLMYFKVAGVYFTRSEGALCRDLSMRAQAQQEHGCEPSRQPAGVD